MLEVRGPQQARSHATRAKLVEAATACLVEVGYAGTSTILVAQRAGVSQGALFKHFASKSALLVASVAHILDGLVEGFQGDVALRLAAKPARTLEERVPPAVAALWGIFRRPTMRAVFEVYIAARTDKEIERGLAPVLERHTGRILEQAKLLFPELADHPELSQVVDAVVYAMQGAVIGLFGDQAPDRLPFFERLALRELEHLRCPR
jgi:AcrR family transcriptional regulator